MAYMFLMSRLNSLSSEMFCQVSAVSVQYRGGKGVLLGAGAWALAWAVRRGRVCNVHQAAYLSLPNVSPDVQ